MTEKMLSVAQEQSINSLSNIIELVTDCIYNHGGSVNLCLNSKEEILHFAELAELAINSLNEEGCFDYHNKDVIRLIVYGFLLFVAMIGILGSIGISNKFYKIFSQ